MTSIALVIALVASLFGFINTCISIYYAIKRDTISAILHSYMAILFLVVMGGCLGYNVFY